MAIKKTNTKEKEVDKKTLKAGRDEEINKLLSSLQDKFGTGSIMKMGD